VRFGVNGFLIGRDTEAEARDVLREIIDKADHEAVEGFGSAVKQAGQSTGDKKGMWQDSEFADLVQYNDGFRTGLIRTPEQIADVAASAAQAGRRAPKFGLNGFLIARDTEAEARETLREIVAKADTEAVEGFGAAVKQAGQSTGDKKGMWQDSTFEDLVQYNDGFRTGLIGTPEQIAERIVAYKKLGVDLLLLGFLHYHEEVEYFGKRVLPLVRELEAQLPESVTAQV
jgi:alkanesulfonate monooxygenase SsuD/methylene tetrahydromethanopterin reductase-like flavin-dependent oxidoreductase (luciferase family)